MFHLTYTMMHGSTKLRFMFVIFTLQGYEMDGTCARQGAISDPHKSLVCTTARPVGIRERRWEDIIKVGF